MTLPSGFPQDKKLLVTGITSIHGWPVYKVLRDLLPPDRLFGVAPPRSKLPADPGRAHLCMTDLTGLERVVKTFQPDILVHCAGICDLDLCEARPDFAHDINVKGAENICRVLNGTGRVYFLSTDLVFSGDQPPPEGYREEDAPSPLSVVGRTMAQAEVEIRKHPAHCILRLGLPLGDSVHGDKGAIDWIEGRFKRNLPASLFYDEFRSCITCDEIAETLLRVVARDLKGLFHFGGKRKWSLYEIGEWIIRKGYPPELLRGRLRRDELNGPPRVGDISLNSDRLRKILIEHD